MAQPVNQNDHNYHKLLYILPPLEIRIPDPIAIEKVGQVLVDSRLNMAHIFIRQYLSCEDQYFLHPGRLSAQPVLMLKARSKCITSMLERNMNGFSV